MATFKESKGFGRSVYDTLSRQTLTGGFEKKFGEATADVTVATGKQSAEYLRNFGASLQKGVEAGSKEWEKDASRSLIGLGDVVATAGAFAEGAKAAPTFLAGATFGTVATPVDMAVMGALGAVSPKAAEKLGEGIEKVYQAAGGSLEDRALIDTTLGMIGIGGLASSMRRGKVGSKVSKGIEGAIEKELNSPTPMVDEVPLMDKIAEAVAAKKKEVNRNLNSSDIIEAVEDAVGEKVDDNGISTIRERDFEPIPDEVYDTVGEKTSMSKVNRKKALDSLESSGLSRDKAGLYIDNVLGENRKVIEGRKELTTKIKEASERVSRGSEEDMKLHGEDLKLLEDNGILSRGEMLDNNNYIFEEGPKATEKLTRSQLASLRGSGRKSYSTTAYDRLISESEARPTGRTFDEVAESLLEEALDNPQDSARILNRIEEANGNVSVLERPQTSKVLSQRVVDSIDDNLIMGKELTPIHFAEIRSLSKRMGYDSEGLFDSLGNIDKSKLDDFISEIDKFKANGFNPFAKLTVPDTLKKMLRRDSQIARAMYAKGIDDTKAIASKRIDELKAKAKTSKGEVKASFLDKIKKIEERNASVTDWKERLYSRVENLHKSRSSFKFYGNADDSAKLLNSFRNKISKVSTYAGYEKVVSAISQGIVEANSKILNAKIAKELQPFRRKAGKASAKTRRIKPEVRMALEIMAQANDKYYRTGYVNVLEGALNDIKELKRIGKEQFREMQKLKKSEVAAIVAESKAMGVKKVGNDALAYDNNGLAAGLYRGQINLLDPVDRIRTVFKGNFKNPAFKQVLKILEKSKDVMLLEGRLFKEVFEPLEKAGLVSKETSRNIALYLMQKQGDWNKRIYDKDGNFIGHNRFENQRFANEGEYKSFMQDINTKIEKNPTILHAINNWKKIRNEIDKLERMVSRTYDGFEKGYISEYYPQRTIRDGVIQEFGEDVFSTKAFTTDYMESRVYAKEIQYVPDFFSDSQRFIRTQGRYANVRPEWGQMNDLIEGGLLSETNKNTKNLMSDFMSDMAKPQPFKSNILSRGSGRLAKAILFLRPTSIISQYLTLFDATLRIPASEIARASVSNDASDIAAFNASKAIQLSQGVDFLHSEKQQIADRTSIGRLIDKGLDLGVKPLGGRDFHTKTIVWKAAYAHWYKKKFGRDFNYSYPDYSNKDGVRIADFEMESIAGSREAARIPPMLRDPYMKAALLLQTFVIKRWGQLTYSLPEIFVEDKIRGTRIVIAYTMSSAMSIVIALGYKETLQAIGEYMGWPIGDDKTIEERITGLKNPSEGDVIFSIASKLLLSNIPLASNIGSIGAYDRTGLGVIDYTKSFVEGQQKAYIAAMNGEEEKAVKESLTAFVGLAGYPGEIAKGIIKGKKESTSSTKDKRNNVRHSPIRRQPPKRENPRQ